MTRGKAPRRPAAAFDRLGDAEEALDAAAVLWRVLAAMPEDARALLLAQLAHKQSPSHLATLVLADPGRVCDALDRQHDFFARRFRTVYGLLTEREITDTPRLPKVFPLLWAALFAYLAQASSPASWSHYLGYLDDQELLDPYPLNPPPSPPDFDLAAPQRLPIDPADLLGADPAHPDWREVDLRGADLRGADLISAKLHGVDLRGSDLCGTDLALADLTYSDFTDANLVGTNLTDTDLTSATLVRARLAGAHLIGTKLSFTDLTHADLTQADLRYVELFGVTLTDADLTGAQMLQVLWSSADGERGGTIWPSPEWAERMRATSERVAEEEWMCRGISSVR